MNLLLLLAIGILSLLMFCVTLVLTVLANLADKKNPPL